MNKQMSMSFLHDELKEVSTNKKVFLERIERIMPWEELEQLIRPYYYEGKYGNKPYELELMLRIHLLQNLYDLSDMGARNEVIDSRAFSDFCGVESSNQVPDGDTLGRFRNLLLKNGLQEKLFGQVVEHVFAVIKQQLRFRKTRYRGLRKQTSKLNMLFALANLIPADRPGLAA